MDKKVKNWQKMNKQRYGQRGVTIIELMIVVLISGILLSVAVPSFQDNISRSRRLSAVQEMASTLAYARTEAVSRATPVSLCPTTDDSTCNGTKWESGVLVFEDDGAGAGTAFDRKRTGDEELIRIYGGASSGITVRSNASFATASGILYGVMGGTVDNGTLKICDSNGVSTASGLVLNRSGQARLATDDDNSGVINDDAGVSLVDCL